jgi:putative nucleotidyltransferase with HDIG domain
MRFSQLPVRLKTFIILQAIAATAIVATHIRPITADQQSLLALTLVLAAVAGTMKVDVNIRLGWISLGFAVTYFALLALGPTAAMLTTTMGVLTGVVYNPKKDKTRLDLSRALSHKALFNLCNGLLSAAVMSWVYLWMGGLYGSFDIKTMALPVLASVFAYYVVNTLGVSIAIGWSQGKHPAHVFRDHFAWAWSGYLTAGSACAALLWLTKVANVGMAPLLLVPFGWWIYYFNDLRTSRYRKDMEHMTEVNRLNESIISSLAMAIDAKDRTTNKHTQRTQIYGQRLAQRLGVSHADQEAIRIAALLHDVGKIGIPESILCKPGKLTSEEFEIMKTHVEIGAGIVEGIPFPWPVVPVVRGHHERWDGLGYPQRQKGEDIVVGARILSIVDVYDALTSDRPYRKAMAKDDAIKMLLANAGTQFDPVAVEAFVQLLPDLEAEIAAIDAQDDEGVTEDLYERIAKFAQRPEPESASEGELLTQIDGILCNQDGGQGFSDSLAQKIGELVPYSTFAVFMADPQHRSVTPIHTAGMWTELLDGLEIRFGEGASGYVAAQSVPVRNVPASLDLMRRIRPGENLELNSTLSVPLPVKGEVVGALTVYIGSYNFYQSYHVSRLEAIAERLGAAMGGHSSTGDPAPVGPAARPVALR